MSRKTHLRIDRLVLYGFPASQCDAVVGGFETELARLIDGGEFGDSRTLPSLQVAPRGNTGTGAGPAAARQLIQGLRR